ncbi:MAG: hypothetical protein Q9190_001805 [Brigantiaea leucoxantha]
MSDSGADTGPVPAEYLRTINIHGRDFQKYSVDHSVHLVPVDEEETDRLELQHRVLDTVFDGRIIFPPVTNVRDVLDCGYGAASWAIEVAETYPQCTVVGVDISPHMKPDDHPGNFDPQLDDINRPFTFSSNKFDVVHSRLVGNGINRTRWPTYLRDIKRVLKPGGWVQLVECYFMCQSDNGSITEAHALRQWSNNYIRSIDGIKNPRAPMQLQAMLHTAGFVSLETTTIQWPLCGWSNGTNHFHSSFG